MCFLQAGVWLLCQLAQLYFQSYQPLLSGFGVALNFSYCVYVKLATYLAIPDSHLPNKTSWMSKILLTYV